MTKSIDKKLAILESYLNENGHVGEAIGVSELRDDDIVAVAKSISEGKCIPPVPEDSCHNCDKFDSETYMVIAYPAKSKEYPKIRRMVRWHTGESAESDETSHVITGADEVASRYGVAGWKNEACDRGIKLGQFIPMRNSAGRVSDYKVVEILNPTPSKCEGPDCGKDPLKIIVQDIAAEEENPIEPEEPMLYGTKENPIEIPRPIEYTYKVTGYVKPDCTISNQEIELTEEQFMRTCFLSNDAFLSNNPGQAHVTDFYTRDDAASYVSTLVGKMILDVESDAMADQRSHCPNPAVPSGDTCPSILDYYKEIELKITSPEGGSEHGPTTPVDVSVELKFRTKEESVPDHWGVKVFYTDRRNRGSDTHAGPLSGAFCTNLTKVGDGKYVGRMGIEHIRPGIFQAWATVFCGDDAVGRMSQPILLTKKKIGE
jgi:hypothetical protein